MKAQYVFRITLFVSLFVWSSISFGQNILENDTLYIGTAQGTAGEQVEIPIYIRTNDYYQGWTIPIKFGDGDSPLICDSVSLVGTTMETWAWTSKFVNNNEWDNVQTCGATGLYVWFGDSLDPGYYLALRLFFTIPTGTPPQTIALDTTTCSFASGGQQNGYIVVVHTQSWLTTVIPGSIVITLVGAEESNPEAPRALLAVTPSLASRGSSIRIRCEHMAGTLDYLSIHDAVGRIVDRIPIRTEEDGLVDFHYPTARLSPGVYFMTSKVENLHHRTKFIIK